MVPEQISEFVEAATALVATIEQTEAYKGKTLPPHVDQHNRAAIARMTAALSHISAAYPKVNAFRFRSHVIFPIVEHGKITSIRVIPAASVMDVDAVLEHYNQQ